MTSIAMHSAALGPARQKREAMLELVRARNLADEATISRAEVVSAHTAQPIEQVLNQLGGLTDDDLVSAYAEIANCEIWDAARSPILSDLGDLGVSVDFLRRSRIAPVAISSTSVRCAVCDPLDDEALAGFVFATGRDVTFAVARPADWRRSFEGAFPAQASTHRAPDARQLEREIELVSDNSVAGAGARIVATHFGRRPT